MDGQQTEPRRPGYKFPFFGEAAVWGPFMNLIARTSTAPVASLVAGVQPPRARWGREMYRRQATRAEKREFGFDKARLPDTPLIQLLSDAPRRKSPTLVICTRWNACPRQAPREPRTFHVRQFRAARVALEATATRFLPLSS